MADSRPSSPGDHRRQSVHKIVAIKLAWTIHTAHVDRRVHVDEPCVLIGWLIAHRGRKYEVGTALFDEDGEACARARATWVEPRQV